MKRIIRITPADNVAVAIDALEKGDLIEIGGLQLTAAEDIPAGHKMALTNFDEGNIIVKYGSPIGHITVPVRQGAWVNEHNLKTNLEGIGKYNWNKIEISVSVTGAERRTFMGYRRKNGDVGTRNEVWIIPTVGCVAGVAEKLAGMLQEETGGKDVDAIVAFTHNYGCSQLGDDHENTRKILRGMALHPNAGGVLFVGLGCENNQPDALRDFLGEYDTGRIRFITCQKCKDEIAEGMAALRGIYSIASKDVREETDFSHLRVGLKCGGSDGFSGITANPLLGAFSDFITAQGGTTILTEVPEMFGAETQLMNRCPTRELFDKTVNLINDFKTYFIESGQPVYENPSPGNKTGGISTLEEKSLGCTQKSGTSPVKDVLMYGERLHTNGLNLLSAPGNDLVASTALAAAGCQLVLFTTGRGTPFGTFVPTLKVSTNTSLAEDKPSWTDFNAGTLLTGESMESLLQRFIEHVGSIASGTYTRNEENGYRGMAIFKTGVTL